MVGFQGDVKVPAETKTFTMATIYRTKISPINPEALIDEYVGSDYAPEEGLNKMKELNKNRTKEDLKNGIVYCILAQNYTKKEFES